MKFKRGDIIAFEVTDTGSTGVFVLDYTYGGNSCCVICGVTGEGELVFNERGWGIYDSHRFAMKSDKTILFNALAKENKYYCEETKIIKEMKKKFKKKDLKSGMWVELRNGDRYMVIKDCETASAGKQQFCLITNNGYLVSDEYTDCLTCSDREYDEFDICAVYSTNGDAVSAKTYTGEYMSIIWERNDSQEGIRAKIDELRRIIDELKAELR